MTVTDATLDGVNEVRAALVRAGCDHRIHVAPPAEWDELQDGLYVTGYRLAGLDKCAFVDAAGDVQWLR